MTVKLGPAENFGICAVVARAPAANFEFSWGFVELLRVLIKEASSIWAGNINLPSCVYSFWQEGGPGDLGLVWQELCSVKGETGG